MREDREDIEKIIPGLSTKKQPTEEFTELQKEIFRLGVLEGERRLQYRLNILQKANNNLWKELIDLDEREPLIEVTMTRTECRRIIEFIEEKTGGMKSKSWYQRRGNLTNWLYEKLKEAEEIKGEIRKVILNKKTPENG